MKTSNPLVGSGIVVLLFAACGGCGERRPERLDGASEFDAQSSDAGATNGTLAPCDGSQSTRCVGNRQEQCSEGLWVQGEVCSGVCDDLLGCVDCRPSERRLCLANEVRACTSEGLIGPILESCPDDNACTAGYCGGCAANSDLIYLLDSGGTLLSFDPRTSTMNEIGNLACPSTSGVGTHSMAVDRRGVGWVLYQNGSLYQIDLTTAACSPTDFEAGQNGFNLFGMAFVAESPGGLETLYIAGGSSVTESTARLGTIDTQSLRVDAVAPLTVTSVHPELTGDGAGGLYGYFPGTERIPDRVSALNRETGRIETTVDAVTLAEDNSVGAWAIARWGGVFYVFSAFQSRGAPPEGTSVFRVDPETTERVLVHFSSNVIVGAGVSTCAPLLI